jgi:hypothetical protein
VIDDSPRFVRDNGDEWRPDRRAQPTTASAVLGFMRNYTIALGPVITVAAVLTAGCATATPVSPPSAAPVAASGSADPAAAAAHTPYCVSAQLRLEQGPLVPEATEQHTLIVEFRNTAGTACTLHGYPQIQLIDDHGARLAFTYQHRQDQMITGEPPILVTLPPGGVAYAALNQNTCDDSPLAEWRQATKIEVTPPGVGKSMSANLRPYPSLDYCGPAQSDNRVDVTPIEPTITDIYPDR